MHTWAAVECPGPGAGAIHGAVQERAQQPRWEHCARCRRRPRMSSCACWPLRQVTPPLQLACCLACCMCLRREAGRAEPPGPSTAVLWQVRPILTLRSNNCGACGEGMRLSAQLARPHPEGQLALQGTSSPVRAACPGCRRSCPTTPAATRPTSWRSSPFSRCACRPGWGQHRCHVAASSQPCLKAGGVQ